MQRYSKDDCDRQTMSVAINNAYAGFWSSQAHNISLRYDEKVWTLIDNTDSKKETFCNLQDIKGGSSFALRVEYSPQIRNMKPCQIESVLQQTLGEADPELKVAKRGQLLIANRVFQVIDYCLDNKIYGTQIARHAYLINDDYALLLLMAWPKKLHPVNNNPFPAKYLSFINGLNLKSYIPLNS